MTPPQPALIQCETGSTIVLARPLGLIGANPALVEGEGYRQVGTVRESAAVIEAGIRTVWRAYDMTGSQVAIGRSKREAIDLLLDRLGLCRTEFDDTIPDLLSGL